MGNGRGTHEIRVLDFREHLKPCSNSSRSAISRARSSPQSSEVKDRVGEVSENYTNTPDRISSNGIRIRASLLHDKPNKSSFRLRTADT